MATSSDSKKITSPDDASSTASLLDDAEAQLLTLRATPLPKLPLAALCLARLADPINFSQIFPYINEFLTRLHVTDDIDRIGFYSGFIESAFALCQLLTIYQWTRLSDRIGRRPVIMLGMAGLALSTLGFGFSKSIVALVIFRCLGGLFSGNAAAVHAVLGELTDSTNQHIAFPIYGLCWPLGNVIGPLIGGSLSAAEHWGSLFNSDFFRHYPYFLPCLASALVALFTVAFIWVYLHETLPSLRKDQMPTLPPSLSRKHNYGSISCHSPGKTHPQVRTLSNSLPNSEPSNPSVKLLLSMKAIRTLCISGCAMCFEAMSFDVVFVLFCFTPIRTGGLGFNAQQIGTCLAVSGIIGVLLQIAVMPPLLRRFHASSLYLTCMWLWPVTFILFPILSIIRKAEARPGVDALGPGITAALSVILILSKLGSLGYSLSLLLVKIHSPSPETLASANSLVQSFMLVSRSIAPMFVSSVFAFSAENDLLGGQMWVYLMTILCIFGCWASYGLREEHDDDEDSDDYDSSSIITTSDGDSIFACATPNSIPEFTVQGKPDTHEGNQPEGDHFYR